MAWCAAGPVPAAAALFACSICGLACCLLLGLSQPSSSLPPLPLQSLLLSAAPTPTAAPAMPPAAAGAPAVALMPPLIQPLTAQCCPAPRASFNNRCRLGDFVDRLSEFDKEMNGVVIESGAPRFHVSCNHLAALFPRHISCVPTVDKEMYGVAGCRTTRLACWHGRARVVLHTALHGQPALPLVYLHLPSLCRHPSGREEGHAGTGGGLHSDAARLPGLAQAGHRGGRAHVRACLGLCAAAGCSGLGGWMPGLSASRVLGMCSRHCSKHAGRGEGVLLHHSCKLCRCCCCCCCYPAMRRTCKLDDGSNNIERRHRPTPAPRQQAGACAPFSQFC